MLNFNHVYYFHVAATEGSVKAAAEYLGVTQPTVSEQIKLLERALGVALFERTGTGLRLTDAGKEVFQHTTAMFHASERLMRAVGRTDTQPTAFRVGVSMMLSRAIAADFLVPVLAVPRCRPVLRTADPLDLLRDLRAHELDLVISDTEPVDTAGLGLTAVTLHRPPLVAITRDVDPSPDWHDVAVLEHRQASTYRRQIDNYLQQNGLRPNGVAELDDALLMVEAVARGGLVAFVPWSVARDAVTAGRVRILAELQPGSAAVFALYHRTDAVDLARQAVDLLTAHAQEHSPS